MNDETPLKRLEKANQQLEESLRACHHLVAEYRAKLAANGNEPLLLDEGGRDSDAVRS